MGLLTDNVPPCDPDGWDDLFDDDDEPGDDDPEDDTPNFMDNLLQISFQLSQNHRPSTGANMKRDDATQMLRLLLGRTYLRMPGPRKKELVELLEYLPPSAMMRDFEQRLHSLLAGAEKRAKAHQCIAEFWDRVVVCLNKRGRQYTDLELDDASGLPVGVAR